jgi:hypothetical protein
MLVTIKNETFSFDDYWTYFQAFRANRMAACEKLGFTHFLIVLEETDNAGD